MSATDVSPNVVFRLQMLHFSWDSMERTRVIPLITNTADMVEIISGSVVSSPVFNLNQLSFDVLLQIGHDPSVAARNISGDFLETGRLTTIAITSQRNLRFRLVDDNEELFRGEKHVCSVIVRRLASGSLFSFEGSSVAHLVCKVEDP